MFEGELPSELVGLVTLEDLDVLLLATTDVDGDRQELCLPQIGRASVTS